MLCIEGTGALSHVSLRNKPDVFNEPCVFAAVAVKGDPAAARVLEGPVPRWKLFGPPETGNGAGGKSYGLPRFASATFLCRFPFATVTLTDPEAAARGGDHRLEPVRARRRRRLEPAGGGPRVSLPQPIESSRRGGVLLERHELHGPEGRNSPKGRSRRGGGFVLWGGPTKDKPWEEGAFCASVADPKVKVNQAWFRGGWFDPLTMAWKDVAEAACFDRAPVARVIRPRARRCSFPSTWLRANRAR